MNLFILILCILGLYLRIPDRFFNPQFWAEDGPILFIQAVTGGLQSIFEPYQGALYSYQRIGAFIAVQFPWEYVPSIFMIFNWIGFFIAIFWCLSDRLPFNRPVKILMAIWIAYAPVKNETYLNLINVHWTLCGLGLLLLLMSNPPKNKKQSIFDYCMYLLLGLTGPFCLIYFPLFLLKIHFQRNRHNYIILGVISVCAVIQIFQLPTRDYQVMGGVLNTSIEQFFSVIDFRFIWVFLGYEILPFRTLSLPISILIFSSIVILSTLIIIELFKGKTHLQIYLRTVPFLACILILTATFVQYREMPEALINGTRYFFIPIITFLWAITFASESNPRLFVPLMIVPGLVFLSHPKWDEYAMPDLKWKASVECLHNNPNCVVPIHPLYFNFSVFSPNEDKLIPAKEIFKRMKENSPSVK